jgi:hypothetical protein
MDTAGLIRKLSEFLAPLPEKFVGERCRSQSMAYMNGLKTGVAWATRSKLSLEQYLICANCSVHFGGCIFCVDKPFMKPVTSFVL